MGRPEWAESPPPYAPPIFLCLSPQLGKFTGLKTALILGGDK